MATQTAGTPEKPNITRIIAFAAAVLVGGGGGVGTALNEQEEPVEQCCDERVEQLRVRLHRLHSELLDLRSHAACRDAIRD